MVKSTRSNRKITASQAIIEGLAIDGGLYVFEHIPTINWSHCLDMNYQTLSCYILEILLEDYTKEEIKEAVSKAYDDKFLNPNIVDFKHTEKLTFLELFHGPTLAFKDMALQILPELLRIAKIKNNCSQETIILTATSGDTGGATLSGFQNVDGMRVIVFYPYLGISEIQEKQMLSFKTNNTEIIALEGNFDDAQKLVKEAFQKYPKLSSSNSINIGRLAPQVIYYFYSYLEMIRKYQINSGEKINVCIPTGNFGNILAAYIAKKMGLPINKLLCASNENKVLTDFFNDGIYNCHRSFYKTNSPSMDILISSNLERLIYYLSGEEETKALMQDLNMKGKYHISQNIKNKLSDFYGDSCSDSETIETIKKVFTEKNYLIDPHTAVAYSVYEKYLHKTNDTTKTLIVSTASPYKFPETIATALNIKKTNLNDLLQKISTLSNIKIPDAISNYQEIKPVVWLKNEQKEKFAQLMEKNYDNS